MATYQATIKIGDSGSPFQVQVVAGSYNTATETIETIYSPTYIRNLRQVSCKDEYNRVETGSSAPSSGQYWFVGFMIALYISVTYWYFVVPAAAIIAILWFWSKDA